MKVRLKVIAGGTAGQELKIPVGEFFIGRGEGCHLRARSDAISRKHCAIVVAEGDVKVKDLQSRNGTLVNGDKIDGERPLIAGDKLTVGPLEFEVLVDHALGGEKRPQVKNVAEAVARATSRPSKLDEDDIFAWLEEGDDAARQQRLVDPETRQFKLEAGKDETTAAEGDDDKKKKKKEKKEYGKLPPIPVQQTANSQEAAADALRKFFKRD